MISLNEYQNITLVELNENRENTKSNESSKIYNYLVPMSLQDIGSL